MARLRTSLVAALLDPAVVLTPGDVAHVADHEQLALIARNTAYFTGDYGADKFGNDDNTSLYVQANAELLAAGGGRLVLDDNGLYMGNALMQPGVSLKGQGWRSRVQGIPGAGVPIVKMLGTGEGNSVEDLMIVGNRSHAGLPDGPLPDGTADPEIGLWNNSFGSYVRHVYVFNTRGPGYYADKGGIHVDSVLTFWTGGIGFWQSPGTGYDSRFSNLYIGPAFGAAGIATGAGACIWTNCRSFGQGSHLVSGQIKWDPADRITAAWSISSGQILNGVYADDSAIGYLLYRGANQLSGIAAGCLIPVRLAFLNPDGTDGDNDIDVLVACQDRFTPRCAIDAYLPWGTKAFVHVNWETATIPSSQGMNVGTKIRDYVDPETGPFKVVQVSSLSSGTPTLYDRNEYQVNGEDAWVHHQASTDGALTPDFADGCNYVVNLDADVTINAFIDRGGLAAGRRLSFLFTRPAGTNFNVAWNAKWVGAVQPDKSSACTLTFQNRDGLFGQNAFALGSDMHFIGRDVQTFFDISTLPNLKQWHNANRFQNTADGAALSSWPELSGNGQALAQATGSLQPILHQGAFGERPGVRFDGVDDFMASANFAAALSAVTIHVVCRMAKVNTAANEVFLDGSTGTGRMSVYQAASGGLPKWGGYAGGTAAVGGTADLAAHVVTMRRTGTSVIVYLDGAQVASTNAAASGETMPALRLGSDAAGAEFAPVDIGEVVVVGEAQGENLRLQTVAALANKWGTPVPAGV